MMEDTFQKSNNNFDKSFGYELQSNSFNNTNLTKSVKQSNNSQINKFNTSIASLSDLYNPNEKLKENFKSTSGKIVTNTDFALKQSELREKKRQLDSFKNQEKTLLSKFPKVVDKERGKTYIEMNLPVQSYHVNDLYLNYFPHEQYKVDVNYTTNYKGKQPKKFNHISSGKINPVKSSFSIKPTKEKLEKEHEEKTKSIILFSHKVNIKEEDNFVTNKINKTVQRPNTSYNREFGKSNNENNYITIGLPHNENKVSNFSKSKSKSKSNSKVADEKIHFQSGKHRHLVKDSEQLFKDTQLFFDHVENKLPQRKGFSNIISNLETVCNNLENLKTYKNKIKINSSTSLNNSNSIRNIKVNNTSINISSKSNQKKNKNIINCDIDEELRRKIEEKLSILHVELRRIFNTLNDLNRCPSDDGGISIQENHDQNIENLKIKAQELLAIYKELSKKLESGNIEGNVIKSDTTDIKFNKHKLTQIKKHGDSNNLQHIDHNYGYNLNQTNQSNFNQNVTNKSIEINNSNTFPLNDNYENKSNVNIGISSSIPIIDGKFLAKSTNMSNSFDNNLTIYNNKFQESNSQFNQQNTMNKYNTGTIHEEYDKSKFNNSNKSNELNNSTCNYNYTMNKNTNTMNNLNKTNTNVNFSNTNFNQDNLYNTNNNKFNQTDLNLRQTNTGKFMGNDDNINNSSSGFNNTNNNFNNTYSNQTINVKDDNKFSNSIALEIDNKLNKSSKINNPYEKKTNKTDSNINDDENKLYGKLNTKNVVRDELFTSYDIELPIKYYYDVTKKNEPKEEEEWYIRRHHIESLTKNDKGIPDDIMNTKYISYYKPDDKAPEVNKVTMIDEVLGGLNNEIDGLRNSLEVMKVKDYELKEKFESLEKMKNEIASSYKEGDYEEKFLKEMTLSKFLII